jgi:hypothetical protein
MLSEKKEKDSEDESEEETDISVALGLTWREPPIEMEEPMKCSVR